jgi:F-type H+-transporting ATPase subunit b
MTVSSFSSVVASGTLVDLDATFFVQIAIFLVLFLLLRPLLFKPVIRLIEARRVATEGVSAEAAELSRKVTALRGEVRDRLGKVRAEAGGERDRLLAESRGEERKVIEGAREEALSTIAEARGDLDRQVSQVRDQLQSEGRVFAEMVVEKVLDRRAAGN